MCITINIVCVCKGVHASMWTYVCMYVRACARMHTCACYHVHPSPALKPRLVLVTGPHPRSHRPQAVPLLPGGAQGRCHPEECARLPDAQQVQARAARHRPAAEPLPSSQGTPAAETAQGKGRSSAAPTGHFFRSSGLAFFGRLINALTGVGFVLTGVGGVLTGVGCLLNVC